MPTASSTWRFVAISNRSEYYIKNLGRPDKDAWLMLQPRKELYRSVARVPATPPGSFENRYKEVTVYDGIASGDNRFRIPHRG